MPTSDVSGNGWPVSEDPDELGCVSFVVGDVDFGLVRGGKVYDLLHYVVTQVHRRVERVDASKGCYAYNYRANVNDPDSWSNHASATAVDFNATAHPNGVSAGATFTAAQEAEIHKILEEVGGAVRWGGDYNSTPDAMHFEINVPPSGVDATAISQSGAATGPAGTWSIADAPAIGPTQWSEPTVSFYMYPIDEHLSLAYPAWWKFTPEQDGVISIDLLESIAAAPYVGNYTFMTIYTGPADAANSAQLTMVVTETGSTSAGEPQTYLDVTAGTTYYICASLQFDYAHMAYVLKLSDYGYRSEWIQAEDQKAYVNWENDSQYTWNFPMPHNAADAGFFSLGSYNWTQDESDATSGGPSFGGSFGLNHSFGGAYPGLDNSATACAFKHARLYAGAGFNWWSSFNGSSWNGTDPPTGVGGFGNCPTLYSGRQDVGTNPGTVGMTVTSSGIDGFIGGGLQDLDVYCYASSQTVGIEATERLLGPDIGHGEIYVPARNEAIAAGWTSPVVELQTDEDGITLLPRITKIEGTPDEPNGGGTYANGSPGAPVCEVWWYSMPGRVDDGFMQGWGPFTWSFESGREGYPIWLGGQSGPENLLAQGGVQKLCTWQGTPENWYDLGDVEYYRLVEDYLQGLIGGTYYGQAYRKIKPHGIILFAISRWHATHDYPFPNPTGIGESYRSYRTGQWMALRVTATPVPFRIVANPPIVDVDPDLIFGILSGGLDEVRQAFCTRADFL